MRADIILESNHHLVQADNRIILLTVSEQICSKSASVSIFNAYIAASVIQ